MAIQTPAHSLYEAPHLGQILKRGLASLCPRRRGRWNNHSTLHENSCRSSLSHGDWQLRRSNLYL